MKAAELMRLRRENHQLRDRLEQMRRERDRALIAGSLHVCYGSDRERPATPGDTGPDDGAEVERG